MALADIQLQRRLEQLINSSLQSGSYPNLSVLQSEVCSWQSLGQPTAQPLAVTPGSVSDTDAYNAFFAQVAEDLACLYEQLWDLFDSERNSFITLENQESALASSLTAMVGANNAGIGDQFTSFKNIDQSQTTAYVDLISHAVTLDNNTILKTMDLSGATAVFSVVSPYTKIETLSPVSDVLNTSEDSYWLSCVHEPSQSAITAQLVINLGSLFTCNNVVVSFQGTPPGVVTLTVSLDGATWINCGTIIPGTWFLPATSIQYFNFAMSKMPDEQNGSDYLVYFGMSSFAINYVGLSDSESLVSLPYPIDQSIINSVDLTVVSQVPPLTDIDYFLSFDGGVWMPISGSLNLQGGTLQQASFTAATACSTIEGITPYELTPDIDTDVLWQPQLVVGTDKYLKMRTYAASVPNNVPTLAVWQGISPYTKVTSYYAKNDFADTSTYSDVATSTNKDNLFFYKFYTQMTGQLWVTITCSAGYNYCLYLNGDLIQVAGNKALLNFIDGQNEIVLILYNYGASAVTNNDWSWNWSLTSQIICANRSPFVLVDYPILLYHTPPGVNNYFSLIQSGQLWTPVVNFNPAIYGLTASDFVLNYQIPNAAMTDVRFKAILSRQSGAGTTTPILSSYQLALN